MVRISPEKAGNSICRRGEFYLSLISLRFRWSEVEHWLQEKENWGRARGLPDLECLWVEK